MGQNVRSRNSNDCHTHRSELLYERLIAVVIAWNQYKVFSGLLRAGEEKVGIDDVGKQFGRLATYLKNVLAGDFVVHQY
jgi:hypothetical protein